MFIICDGFSGGMDIFSKISSQKPRDNANIIKNHIIDIENDYYKKIRIEI